MNTLYHALLMDHYKHPRNRRALLVADFSGQQENVNCGDRVCFSGRICRDTNRFIELVFDGAGCVLSQAVASLVSEDLINTPVDTLASLNDSVYLERLVGTALGVVRLKCAQLSLDALRAGLIHYNDQQEYKSA